MKLQLISAGSAAALRWAFYLDQYHYLKLRVVGENLGYLAVDAHGRDVAAVLFGAPAAHAVKLRPQDLTQLITDADQIVAGKVTRVTDGVNERGMPYTEITIAVADSAKGQLRGGKRYTFRQFGLLEPRQMPNGRVLVAVTPEGFPQWQQGEQVIAFLHRPAARTGLRTTAGLAQGKLTMVNGRVANELDNRGLFEGEALDRKRGSLR